MHSLQQLCLAGNLQFATSALQQLHLLTRLSHLDISNTKLQNNGLAAVVAALPQLLLLNASSNKISKTDTLAGMVCLTSLALSRNPLQINSTKVLAGEPGQHMHLKLGSTRIMSCQWGSPGTM
jgi:Leucine-rich repeat (LRR) protein